MTTHDPTTPISWPSNRHIYDYDNHMSVVVSHSKITVKTNNIVSEHKLNDRVMIRMLFFHQYITMWIYAMPYWSLKFAFVQNE